MLHGFNEQATMDENSPPRDFHGELRQASKALVDSLGLNAEQTDGIHDTMARRVEWLRQMIAAFRALGFSDAEIRAFSLEWYAANVPAVCEDAGLTEDQIRHILRYATRALDLLLAEPVPGHGSQDTAPAASKDARGAATDARPARRRRSRRSRPKPQAASAPPHPDQRPDVVIEIEERESDWSWLASLDQPDKLLVYQLRHPRVLREARKRLRPAVAQLRRAGLSDAAIAGYLRASFKAEMLALEIDDHFQEVAWDAFCRALDRVLAGD
jgi:hypothetical protein